MPAFTVGLSPKAVLAFLFPFITAVSVSVISWVATGDFNEAEIRTALGGLIGSGVAALGAYLGTPGSVVIPDPAPAPDAHPSDSVSTS
jgi:hypothetical protein